MDFVVLISFYSFCRSLDREHLLDQARGLLAHRALVDFRGFAQLFPRRGGEITQIKLAPFRYCFYCCFYHKF